MTYKIATLFLAFVGAPLFGASAAADSSAAVDVKQAAADATDVKTAAADIKSAAESNADKPERIRLSKWVYDGNDLIKIIKKKDFRLLQQIFKRADVDIGSHPGLISLAIYQDAPLEIVAGLLDRGAPINDHYFTVQHSNSKIRDIQFDDADATPFLTHIVHLILTRKPPTPLFWSTLRLLVLRGADVCAMTTRRPGRVTQYINALQHIALSTLEDTTLVVETLIRLGIPLNHALQEGLSPIQCALYSRKQNILMNSTFSEEHDKKQEDCQVGNNNTIEVFVACGAEIDDTMIDGFTRGLNDLQKKTFNDAVYQQIAAGQLRQRQIVGPQLSRIFNPYPAYHLFKSEHPLGKMILQYVWGTQYPSPIKSDAEKKMFLDSLVSREERADTWPVPSGMKKLSLSLMHGRNRARTLGKVVIEKIKNALWCPGEYICCSCRDCLCDCCTCRCYDECGKYSYKCCDQSNHDWD